MQVLESQLLSGLEQVELLKLVPVILLEVHLEQAVLSVRALEKPLDWLKRAAALV